METSQKTFSEFGGIPIGDEKQQGDPEDINLRNIETVDDIAPALDREISSFQVRYDGDLSSNNRVKPGEREIFEEISGIGDSCEFGVFVEAVFKELRNAEEESRNIGIYFSTEISLEAEEMKQIFKDISTCLGEPVRSKDSKIKTLGRYSGITAFSGIAMYQDVGFNSLANNLDLFPVVAGQYGLAAMATLYDIYDTPNDLATEIEEKVSIYEGEPIQNAPNSFLLTYENIHWPNLKEPLEYDGSTN